MSARVHYSFRLHAVHDADLIRWLELQPNKSAAVREALIAYVRAPSLGTMAAKQDEILAAIRALRVVASVAEGQEKDAESPAAPIPGLEEMLRDKFHGLSHKP